jgi:hypothetical protein
MRLPNSCGYLVGAALSIVLLADNAYSADSKDKLTKRAWVGCGSKYSKTPLSPRLDRPVKVACPKGQRPMTRSEAHNACRDQMHPFSFMVMKTENGWVCRYMSP